MPVLLTQDCIQRNDEFKRDNRLLLFHFAKKEIFYRSPKDYSLACQRAYSSLKVVKWETGRLEHSVSCKVTFHEAKVIRYQEEAA